MKEPIEISIVIKDGIVEVFTDAEDVEITPKVYNYDTAFSLKEKQQLDHDTNQLRDQTLIVQ